jgi:hypothetical protein
LEYHKLLITKINDVVFGILTAVAMKSSTFWDITPCSRALLAACFFLALLFSPEDGGDMFLRNFG